MPNRKKNYRRFAAALALLAVGALPYITGESGAAAELPIAAAAEQISISRAEFLAQLAAAAKKVNLAVPETVAARLAGGESLKFEEAARAVAETFHLVHGETAYPQGYVAALLRHGLTDGVRASLGDALSAEDAARLIANAVAYREDLGIDGGIIGGAYRKNMARPTRKKPHYANRAPMMQDAAATSGFAMTMAETGTAAQKAAPPCPPPLAWANTESYRHEEENIFKQAVTSPLSTISIDADTASYSNLRRFITRGQEIPPAALRTEELINYFSYNYPRPTGDAPFSVVTEISSCPWNAKHRLALVALRGAELAERQPSNITFLVDVSGSMYSPDKLPLVKRSLNLLLDRLLPDDTISLVTYASGVETILDGERAENREKIKQAFAALVASGGTSGADGLNAAYKAAEKHRIKGNNRIILCTDGDFNIGPSSDAEMLKLIEEKRKSGIFMSVLGFGMGNYKDSKMEIIADKGNGNYAYIDNIREAKKVLVDDMTKTIYTIAKDVKLQVEFNPAVVAEYRLIGYENRRLQNEDFANDAKDAGELGAGSTVTALYELVLNESGAVENPLRYSEITPKNSDEPFFVKLRYKEPDGSTSRLVEQRVAMGSQTPSENMRWASAVAELGLILTNSPYKGTANLDSVIARAKTAYGADAYGLRHEFVQLVDLLKYSDWNKGK